MSFLSDLAGIAGGAAGVSVRIESAVLPVVELRPFDQAQDPAGSSSGPSWLLRLLKPKLTVTLPTGPLVIAPAGDPPAFPWVGALALAGGVGVVALAVYGAARLVGNSR